MIHNLLYLVYDFSYAVQRADGNETLIEKTHAFSIL